MRKPFVSYEQAEKICEQYPTPFHLYDEKASAPHAGMSERHLPGIPASASTLP